MADRPAAVESMESWLNDIRTACISEGSSRIALRSVNEAINTFGVIMSLLLEYRDFDEERAQFLQNFCRKFDNLLNDAADFIEKIHQNLEARMEPSAKPEAWLLAFLACEYSTGAQTNQSLAPQYAQSKYPHLKAISIDHILALKVIESPVVAPSSLEEVLEQTLVQQIERNKRPGPEIPYNALVEDFKRPYVGNGAVRLHERLQALSREDEKLYAAVLPLIQTSGVGKSRTVVELSKYAPGIVFCIRTTSPHKTSSLPAQDAPIFQFLSKKIPSESFDGLDHGDRMSLPEWWDHCLVAALIIATIDTFKEICTRLLKESGAVGKDLSSEQRNTVLKNFARICVDDIVDGYRSDSGSPGPDANSPGRQMGSGLPGASDRSDQQSPCEPLSSRPAVIEEIARRASLCLSKIHLADKPDFRGDAVAFWTNIASVLGRRIRKHLGTLSTAFDYFFIALDSFSSFSHLLDPMRRIFSQIRDSPLRALVTHSNVNLNGYATQLAAEGSDRFEDGSLRLLPPHLIISHDIELFRPENKTRYYDFITGRVFFTNLEILNFLALMGRPLWADTYMRFRRFKGAEPLVHPLSLPNVFMLMLPGDPNDEAAVIALVASRLPLTISGAQNCASSTTFLQNQILLHLRSVKAFETSGDIVHSWTPSEPIMSLAAADHQRRPQSFVPRAKNSVGPPAPAASRLWRKAVITIRNKQAAGCLILGENGQEFSCISMTIAADLVAASNVAVVDERRLSAHLMMFNLHEWLTQLYGPLDLPEHYQKLVKESWMNFTHFVRLGEQYKSGNRFGRHHLLQLWSRQGVGIGVSNQADWDKLVPFYRAGPTMPNLDDKFDPSKLHCLLIQDKNGSKYSANTSKWHAAKSRKTIDLKPSDFNGNWQPNLDMFLFVDLASPTQTNYYEGEGKHKGTYYVYLGGSDAARYPFMKAWDSKAIEAMIGMLGPHTSATKRSNRPPMGSQEWRDMHWGMAAQGLLGEEEGQTASNHEKQAARQNRPLAGPSITADVGASIEDSDSIAPLIQGSERKRKSREE